MVRIVGWFKLPRWLKNSSVAGPLGWVRSARRAVVVDTTLQHCENIEGSATGLADLGCGH